MHINYVACIVDTIIALLLQAYYTLYICSSRRFCSITPPGKTTERSSSQCSRCNLRGGGGGACAGQMECLAVSTAVAAIAYVISLAPATLVGCDITFPLTQPQRYKSSLFVCCSLHAGCYSDGNTQASCLATQTKSERIVFLKMHD